jgi:hypothetical protein
MSLCYKISPELNMILYVGEGYSSPSDFFAVEKAAFLAHPRQRGMVTIVDALDLSTSFDLHDIRRFIDNIQGLAKNGLEPGPYFMLTRDQGLHLLADAAQLLAGKVDLKARMFHTLQDAIVALGLWDHEKEIFQLWNECKIESCRIISEAAKHRNSLPKIQGIR